MKVKILKILSLVRPDVEFVGSQNFIEEGLLDSFDLIAFISYIDDEFNISIDGIDIIPENFMHIDSIEAMLKKYIG
jgi:acyl carrier protein